MNPTPRWLNRADLFLFAIFLASLLRKALTDLDLGWDGLAYHLPFAALRVGLFERSEFGFGPGLEAVYNGFPPLHDYIKGWLWKLTAEPNSVNLLTVSVFAIVSLLTRHFTRVPLILSALAIAAIPVVHVQLAGAHPDNLSNLPFALALTLTVLALVDDRRDFLAVFVTIVACICFSANVKLQFVAFGWTLFPLVAIFFYFKHVKKSSAPFVRLVFGSTIIAGLIFLSWLPLKSFVLFGNPLYPVVISLFGFELPGVISPSLADLGGPSYLVGKPNAVKWLVSISEYHAFDYRSNPYTIAQGDVPPYAMSMRMGGYLFSYVLSSIFTLVLVLKGLPGSKSLTILSGFLIITIVVAFTPASFELRYLSFWMVGLVLTNLALLWRLGTEALLRTGYVATCVASFFFVASITGYVALWPQGYSFQLLINAYHVNEKLPHGPSGATYCVGSDKLAILAAPYFHRDLPPYNLKTFAQPPCDNGGTFIQLSP